MAIELTADRLRALLVYVPETGSFRWKPRGQRDGSQCNRDREAGSVSKQTGYRTIRVERKLYQAHRLAWLYVYGGWPPEDIDHINGERLDNRIANLRSVPNAVNRQNSKRARSDNRCGVQGVHFDVRRGRWRASVRHEGRAHFLGSFLSPEEARTAYLAAKNRLHAGFVPPEDAGSVAPDDNCLLNVSGLRRCRHDSTTGLVGVTPQQGRWRARVGINKRKVELGLFDTPEAAHEAYIGARIALHGVARCR